MSSLIVVLSIPFTQSQELSEVQEPLVQEITGNTHIVIPTFEEELTCEYLSGD